MVLTISDDKVDNTDLSNGWDLTCTAWKVRDQARGTCFAKPSQKRYNVEYVHCGCTFNDQGSVGRRLYKAVTAQKGDHDNQLEPPSHAAFHVGTHPSELNAVFLDNAGSRQTYEKLRKKRQSHHKAGDHQAAFVMPIPHMAGDAACAMDARIGTGVCCSVLTITTNLQTIGFIGGCASGIGPGGRIGGEEYLMKMQVNSGALIGGVVGDLAF